MTVVSVEGYLGSAAASGCDAVSSYWSEVESGAPSLCDSLASYPLDREASFHDTHLLAVDSAS